MREHEISLRRNLSLVEDFTVTDVYNLQNSRQNEINNTNSISIEVENTDF
jgi:hypothetical protein